MIFLKHKSMLQIIPGQSQYDATFTQTRCPMTCLSEGGVLSSSNRCFKLSPTPSCTKVRPRIVLPHRGPLRFDFLFPCCLPSLWGISSSYTPSHRQSCVCLCRIEVSQPRLTGPFGVPICPIVHTSHVFEGTSTSMALRAIQVKAGQQWTPQTWRSTVMFKILQTPTLGQKDFQHLFANNQNKSARTSTIPRHPRFGQGASISQNRLSATPSNPHTTKTHTHTSTTQNPTKRHSANFCTQLSPEGRLMIQFWIIGLTIV